MQPKFKADSSVPSCQHAIETGRTYFPYVRPVLFVRYVPLSQTPSPMHHPLSDFIYCPHCGSNAFNEHDAYSKRCEKCGFTFYPNASAATVAVITNSQGELLCIRRKHEPARGTLDLPGGFVDPGESITDGLLREVREELGAEVESFQFLFSRPNVYPFTGHSVHTADAFFRCTLCDESAVHAGDDAEEALWIATDDLRPEEFGLESVRQGVALLKKQLSTPTTTDR